MAAFIGFMQAFKNHFSPLLAFVRKNNGKSDKQLKNF